MGGHHRFSNFEIVVLLVMFCVVCLVDAPQIIKAGNEGKLSDLIEHLELMMYTVPNMNGLYLHLVALKSLKRL
ncbi:MAG: hypothetical protein ACYTFM_06280 [Planctomycetota bacterium]|jgi:hypothetical protein